MTKMEADSEFQPTLRRRHKQFYSPSTNVFVTRFLLADGIAELEDFMPVGLPSETPAYHHVYRRISASGEQCAFRLLPSSFQLWTQIHKTHIDANGATFNSGSLTLALSTTIPLSNDGIRRGICRVRALRRQIASLHS